MVPALKPYLIVIPAYNEGESIAGVLENAKKGIPFADILVVNDGSTDDTSRIAHQTGVMVLDIPFNIGYGGAIQTGFRFADEKGYDFVITMDGDGQHDPSSVAALIDSAGRENADVVIGSRFLEGSYRMGILRKAGSWLFSRIARFYTGMNFTDPTSGFQLLNSRVFSYLSKDDNYPLDYPDVNIIMALHKMNFKVVEAPVRMVEKPQGKSMHAGLKPIFYIMRMVLAIIMILFRKD
jgi:glycosyltransferase involved in cell wall biosynthesis